jgi:hypothetical protein
MEISGLVRKYDCHCPRFNIVSDLADPVGYVPVPDHVHTVLPGTRMGALRGNVPEKEIRIVPEKRPGEYVQDQKKGVTLTRNLKKI